MFSELAQYLKVDGRPVRLLQRSATEVPRGWANFAAHAPWLRAEHVRVPGLGATETELVGTTPHGSITFVGDVEEEQLRALAHGLRALATQPEWDSPHTADALRELDSPVDLEVYVSPLCPFCATVSAAVLRFAAASASVNVRIIRADVGAVPEGVHTLPTVRADGVVVATGAADEHTLVRQISVYQRSMPPPSVVAPISRSRNLPSSIRNAAPMPPSQPAKSRRQRSTAA